MGYREQQRYLERSRLWGAAAIASVLAVAAICLVSARQLRSLPTLSFVLIVLALALSIQYTPDYLWLSVDLGKGQRWEIRIRWRLIGAALILGALSVSRLPDALWLLAAVGWATAANALAAKLPRAYSFLYFWITDFILLAVLFLSGKLSSLAGTALLAATGHLSVVICQRRALLWAGLVGAMGGSLLFPLSRGPGAEGPEYLLSGSVLILLAAFTSAFLVERAHRQNRRNVEAALKELEDFTGYPPERIQYLWSTSNQQLARNWQSAGLDEAKGDDVANWYRENSELYVFAISAYNLEYKRILSNLKILRLARGSCLDYGAGNGEILLELARRGHSVSYYDVEGVSMRFARQRAANQGLKMEFLHSKDSLAAWVRDHGGFDTIFSLDVLEHLPDLPGELDFLSSLLNRGGLFVFDVPAGSTKAHPMHLNHNLNVRSYMIERGLKEDRSMAPRFTFRKEEKYFFRAP